ncbi:MAG: acetylornithine deacetylase, partial [Stellaceae bacterium]
MTDAAVAILERLVAFDTVSATSNLNLVGWVADYLDGLGIESVLTRNAEGTKANLYATVGPGGRGGI